MLPSSCVTPAGTSNELDVQNKWEENTHTAFRVLSGDGLVGGNPTMNSPRLRRGGGVATSSSLVLLVLILYYIVHFVCDSASELERWALLPFGGGFPALTCFLLF